MSSFRFTPQFRQILSTLRRPRKRGLSAWCRIACLGWCLPLFTGAAESAVDTPVLLDTFRVTAARIHPGDLEGVDSLETYDPDAIADTGAFSIEEFLGTLAPDTTGGEQLVLIDGRPTYIDPDKLPLGMIESVEVSNEGSMPKYGAYATGRIINIRLKKDYRGQELGLKVSDTLAGGGGRRTFRASGAESHGKLRLFYSLTLEKSDALSSAERSFSREQDHTEQGGRDLRLAWGYPAVVQAATGTLNGVFTTDGAASSVALAPATEPDHALETADFTGADADASGEFNAAGQRRFNTSSYQLLQSPAKKANFNFGGTYALANGTDLSLSGSYSEARGSSQSAPPVTPASEATRVPAAYNPFGQDVFVGLVHVGFGPVRQHTESSNAQLGARLSGRYAETWSWSSGLGYRRSESQQTATDLDRTKFTASLQAADPELRLDPFGGPNSTAHNALLYPDLTVLRTNSNVTQSGRLDLSANGEAFHAWGGPATVSLNAQAGQQQQDRLSENSLSTTTPESHQNRTNVSMSGVTTLPIAGKGRPLRFAHRLEAQLSAGYSGQDDDSSGRDGDIGVLWAPRKEIVLRAKYGVNVEESAGRIVASPTSLTRETLIDPLRPEAAASEVQIVSREDFTSRASQTDRVLLGGSIEIPKVDGLRFSASYRLQRRHHVLQRQFDAQDVVDNEAVFPGRVVRAAPSASDLDARRPGQVISVDVTPGNAGEARNQNLDMNLNFTRSIDGWGRFRVAAYANHVLEARREVEPGKAFVSTQSNRLNPPSWVSGMTLGWSSRQWTFSSQTRSSSAGISDPAGTAGFTTVDVTLAYQFGPGSERRRPGEGLRIGLGVGNLFDTPPPHADTVSGYRLGSALGRTFNLSCSLTL